MTTYLHDLYARNDLLDFRPYVETLADIIAEGSTQTPLTVGVYGAWGTGKTTLMRMVEARLAERNAVLVWFDAWKYQKEEALWRGLIICVLAALRGVIEGEKGAGKKQALARLDDLESSLYHAVEREELGEINVDWAKIIQGVTKGAVHVGMRLIPGVGKTLADLLKKSQEEFVTGDIDTMLNALYSDRRTYYREHIQSIEQFQSNFSELVREHVVEKEKRLVVFIDDLDRCLPEKTIEVLESIKLFMDVEGCVFMLGVDPQVIARAIEIRYREITRAGEAPEEQRRRFLIEGTRYLEKVIQLPFQIPRIDRRVMHGFVTGLLTDWPDAACPDVFVEAVAESPRQVKRTVNAFLLLWRLAEKRGLDIQPVRLAKVVAIQQVVPELYDELKRNPSWLARLEAHLRSEAEQGDRERDPEPKAEEERQDRLLRLPAPVRPHAGSEVVRRILMLHAEADEAFNFAGLETDALRSYFTLTRRTEEPDLKLGSEVGTVAATEPETVPVPEGPFLMGSTPEQVENKKADEDEVPQHTVHLSAYRIGKYPVTNAEYEAFVRDSGHRAPDHWQNGTYPEEKGDHPVANVSWEDAESYCAWLSRKTSKPYRLPTEAQWEKAARGEKGRIYPWDDEWDPEKLNSREKGPGDTTRVGAYSPGGDSPYGAADMAGNVWEWCSDWFDEKEYERRAGGEVQDPTGPSTGYRRVLRGGSFDVAADLARAALRNRNGPDYRRSYYGFRVVLHPFSEL